MKKILTLLLATGVFATLHAQSREETRRVILGAPKDNGTYGGRDRDVILGGGNNGQYPSYPDSRRTTDNRRYEIDQINREYSAKIQSIRNNRYLSNSEKDRAIRQLEQDRQRRINEINRRYSGSYGRNNNNRYDRYDDRDERHDNGKHKGWYKGKGNPHNNGNKHWKKGKD